MQHGNEKLYYEEVKGLSVKPNDVFCLLVSFEKLKHILL
jgi:hypothetical protein